MAFDLLIVKYILNIIKYDNKERKTSNSAALARTCSSKPNSFF